MRRVGGRHCGSDGVYLVSKREVTPPGFSPPGSQPTVCSWLEIIGFLPKKGGWDFFFVSSKTEPANNSHIGSMYI